MKSDSAMPEKIKRETLVNELLRRLTNTTQYLPSAAAENIKVTNAYMQTMKLSGYGEKIRRETALAGIKGLQEKLRKSKEEGGRLHRHMEEGALERHNARISMKSSWFAKKRRKEQPPPNKPRPTLSLAKQRRLKKRQSGVPRPKPQHKADNREIETVIFVPHTARSSLRNAL